MFKPFRRAPVVAALIASALAVSPAFAADHAKPAAKAAAKPQQVKAVSIPDAQPDQVKAAELVYYGSYDCEFQQNVHVVQSPKYPSYVDVKFGSGTWLGSERRTPRSLRYCCSSRRQRAQPRT